MRFRGTLSLSYSQYNTIIYSKAINHQGIQALLGWILAVESYRCVYRYGYRNKYTVDIDITIVIDYRYDMTV